MHLTVCLRFVLELSHVRREPRKVPLRPDEANEAQSGSDKDAQIKQLEADLSEAREAKKRVTERLVLTRWNQAFSAAKEEAVPLEQPQSLGLSQMLLMSMGIDGVASPPEFELGFQAHATRASTN